METEPPIDLDLPPRHAEDLEPDPDIWRLVEEYAWSMRSLGRHEGLVECPEEAPHCGECTMTRDMVESDRAALRAVLAARATGWTPDLHRRAAVWRFLNALRALSFAGDERPRAWFASDAERLALADELDLADSWAGPNAV